MNPDTIKLTGDTLPSVHQEVDEDEEMIFAELYKELVAADTRATRSSRGRGRGFPVGGGRGKGLLVRRTSTSEGGTQTYTRRDPSSSNPIALPSPRELSFDDDGNVISHSEDEGVSASGSLSEDSSSNSLDDRSDSEEDESSSHSDSDSD